MALRSRHRTRGRDRGPIGDKPKARIDIDTVLGVDDAVMIPVRYRKESRIARVRSKRRVQQRLVGAVHDAVPIDVASERDFVAESGGLGSRRWREFDDVGSGGIEREERVARVAGRLRKSRLESTHRRGSRLPAEAVDFDLERHLAGLGGRQFVRPNDDVGTVDNTVGARSGDQVGRADVFRLPKELPRCPEDCVNRIDPDE